MYLLPRQVLVILMMLHLSLNGVPRDDILLIINFSYAHYECIDFLKKLYSPYFSKILFYGPVVHKGVGLVNDYKGWYSYRSLLHAMNFHKNFRGYLWIHDDVVINPWNLNKLDDNTIWFSRRGFDDHVFLSGLANLQDGLSASLWWVWPYPCGFNAVNKIYSLLEQKYRDNIVSNCGQDHVPYGYSDIVYIPARFSDDCCRLLNLCSGNDVFLEIALPVVCSSLVKHENMVVLNGVQLWWDGKRKTPEKFYNYSIDYIHPFKFSEKNLRDFIANKFSEH